MEQHEDAPESNERFERLYNRFIRQGKEPVGLFLVDFLTKFKDSLQQEDWDLKLMINHFQDRLIKEGHADPTSRSYTRNGIVRSRTRRLILDILGEDERSDR